MLEALDSVPGRYQRQAYASAQGAETAFAGRSKPNVKRSKRHLLCWPIKAIGGIESNSENERFSAIGSFSL